MTTTYTHSVSDGSATLAAALKIAIYDYQRVFGHEPRMIICPYWRLDEIDERQFTGWNTGKGAKFRNIPFRLSITCDAIELKTHDEYLYIYEP